MAKEDDRGLGSLWASFIEEMGLLATADGVDVLFCSDFCCRSRSVRPRDGASCRRDPMSIVDGG